MVPSPTAAPNTLCVQERLRAARCNGMAITTERAAMPIIDSTDTERVRAFVKQLRAKLGDDAARPAYIFNERGVGYRMARPGEE